MKTALLTLAAILATSTIASANVQCDPFIGGEYGVKYSSDNIFSWFAKATIKPGVQTAEGCAYEVDIKMIQSELEWIYKMEGQTKDLAQFGGLTNGKQTILIKDGVGNLSDELVIVSAANQITRTYDGAVAPLLYGQDHNEHNEAIKLVQKLTDTARRCGSFEGGEGSCQNPTRITFEKGTLK